MVQVGVSELVEDGAVQWGEEDGLGVLTVGGGFGFAGGECFAELVLALFVFFQDFAGSLDDAAGQAGQAGYLDAVAFVGAAGFDVAEKDDFVGCFFYGDVDVFHTG